MTLSISGNLATGKGRLYEVSDANGCVVHSCDSHGAAVSFIESQPGEVQAEVKPEPIPEPEPIVEETPQKESPVKPAKEKPKRSRKEK